MKIFHHNDADGRCSAYICRKFTKLAEGAEVKFYEMDYATPFPIDDIQTGEAVFILDYSIDPEMMMKLMTKTTAITWIDHHKTAIERYDKYVWTKDIYGARQKEGVSATMLCWRYFTDIYNVCNLGAEYDPLTPPMVVKLIDDWDIWKHEYEQTKPFILALNSEDCRPENTNLWDHLFGFDMPENFKKTYRDASRLRCGVKADEGLIMMTYRDGWARDVLKHIGTSAIFDGLRVFCVNIPHSNSEFFKSIDASQYDAFMPYYFDAKKNAWTVSLYATRGDVDVSEVCKGHGGGGHKGAAGFTTSINPVYFLTEECLF